MAREINYRPDAAVRATRAGKFGNIALLMARIGSDQSCSDSSGTPMSNRLAVVTASVRPSKYSVAAIR